MEGLVKGAMPSAGTTLAAKPLVPMSPTHSDRRPLLDWKATLNMPASVVLVEGPVLSKGIIEGLATIPCPVLVAPKTEVSGSPAQYHRRPSLAWNATAICSPASDASDGLLAETILSRVLSPLPLVSGTPSQVHRSWLFPWNATTANPLGAIVMEGLVKGAMLNPVLAPVPTVPGDPSQVHKSLLAPS